MPDILVYESLCREGRFLYRIGCLYGCPYFFFLFFDKLRHVKDKEWFCGYDAKKNLQDCLSRLLDHQKFRVNLSVSEIDIQTDLREPFIGAIIDGEIRDEKDIRDFLWLQYKSSQWP